jgi:hypothetical protein
MDLLALYLRNHQKAQPRGEDVWQWQVDARSPVLPLPCWRKIELGVLRQSARSAGVGRWRVKVAL